MYKLLLVIMLNTSEYEVGEVMCKYDNGEYQVIQIKGKDGTCIEAVVNDLRFREVMYYRNGQICGFCGEYQELRGQPIQKYIERKRRTP